MKYLWSLSLFKLFIGRIVVRPITFFFHRKILIQKFQTQFFWHGKDTFFKILSFQLIYLKKRTYFYSIQEREKDSSSFSFFSRLLYEISFLLIKIEVSYFYKLNRKLSQFSCIRTKTKKVRQTHSEKFGHLVEGK